MFRLRKKEADMIKKIEVSEARFAHKLIAPSMVLIFGLVLLPLLYAVYMTLFKVGVLGPTSEFLGLRQYIRVVTDRSFWSSLRVTVYFTVVSLALQTVLGIAVALLLNLEFRGRGFMRGIILAPWAVPTIVNAQLWGWIYNASYGVLNKILIKLGMISKPIIWLGTSSLAINSVIAADTWRMTPLYVLMFLSGLQTINGELYEAAKVDGAGAWRRFCHITLPLLKPIILVVLVLRTMQALRVFEIIYQLTQGGPNNSTMVVSFYAYFKTFSSLDFGYGSTIGMLIAVITIIITLVYKKVLEDKEV